jgi:uncharacterized protein DUF1264
MRNPTIRRRPSPLAPPGDDRSTWRATLEAGARLLQETAPLNGFDIYVVGLHCGKDMPDMQMEAHHYCRQVNQELLQCVIFDGNTREANLIGLEYIISERLFETLPEEERGYWHPHNYELLSGQLTAPGLPDVAERAFLRELMNSYGKTWHTWHTGRHGEPGHALPLGPAQLMWSFNRDGEADEHLRAELRDAMDFDEEAQRAQRRDWAELAHPQHGVDAMADRFSNTTPLPGVVDAGP